MGTSSDTLIEKWEQQFPGFSPVMQALRQAVVFAEVTAIESRAAFETFHLELSASGEEMSRWHRAILQRFILLKRQHQRDARCLTSAIASAQAACSTKAEAKTKEEAPPRKPLDKTDGWFEQNVEVTVVDGKTISKIDVGPRHWLETRPIQLCNSWVRHYYFPTAEIPEEYAFVLQHKGLYYGPTRSVYISYETAEFLRICQREVDTQSEHALDGERWSYWRLSENEPIERPKNEDQEEE